MWSKYTLALQRCDYGMSRIIDRGLNHFYDFRLELDEGLIVEFTACDAEQPVEEVCSIITVLGATVTEYETRLITSHKALNIPYTLSATLECQGSVLYLYIVM
jgi:hypothetical protein